jgi:hypothetical protein
VTPSARGHRRRLPVEWEQLPLVLELPAPRWRFSRLVTGSRHFARIRERLDFVRAYFPELDGLSIRVGLAQKRGVLGWGSMDPEAPGIWVRPRSLALFTIAHELTHLLQARGEVPGGERACDLFALARAAAVVDSPPQYLKLPKRLRHLEKLEPAVGAALHRAAREALAVRAAGRRNYLQAFERAVERMDAAASAGGQWNCGASTAPGADLRIPARRSAATPEGGR